MRKHCSKICDTCGIGRRTRDYRRTKFNPDGLHTTCKLCNGSGERLPDSRYTNDSGVCRLCGKGSPEVEFGIDRGTKLGISTICKDCKRVEGIKHRALHGEQIRLRGAEQVRQNRYEALIHYGGLPPTCACCAESFFEFLAIDHINGGGREHLRSIGRSAGNGFCNWLRLNGYPEGFRVLCHNCNMATKEGRPCPHNDPLWERDVSGLSRRLLYEHTYRTTRRKAVLTHYGGNPPTCACCGETHFRFLAIDHINGGGYQHMMRENGTPLDHLLFRDGFPPGYRILCHNCNMARGFYGRCPHDANTDHP